jgi:pseudaminic acid cytidylyltransferase
VNVAIIPARGQSRRIPRKNIRPFHGKPIIAYSIEAAKASGLFDAVWVSTEDLEIAAVARDYGAKWFCRTAGQEIDSVGTQEVARDFLLKTGADYDYACCIYATAPMLSRDDLRMGFALLGDRSYVYVKGLFYWGRADTFLRDVPLSVGMEIPFPAGRYIDINTPEDWDRAERMYAELHGIAS